MGVPAFALMGNSPKALPRALDCSATLYAPQQFTPAAFTNCSSPYQNSPLVPAGAVKTMTTEMRNVPHCGGVYIVTGFISFVRSSRSNVATIFGDVSFGVFCPKLLSHDPNSTTSKQQVDRRIGRFLPESGRNLTMTFN